MWVTFRDIALDDEPFATIGEEFERDRPAMVRRGRLCIFAPSSQGSARGVHNSRPAAPGRATLLLFYVRGGR